MQVALDLLSQQQHQKRALDAVVGHQAIYFPPQQQRRQKMVINSQIFRPSYIKCLKKSLHPHNLKTTKEIPKVIY